MPELTVDRRNAAPPPMVCMYCGAPATSTREWRVENRNPQKGAGEADFIPGPTGDDPISAVFGLVMLPFILWELLKGLVTAIGALARLIKGGGKSPVAPPPRPPKELPTTLVVVTTCDRHRRFRARFAWAGVAIAIALAPLWWWAIAVTRRVMGTDDVNLATTLLVGAILLTILLPLALAIWYAFRGPVIVERVTGDTVVLDRVRQEYFDVTGIKPSNPT